MCDSTNNKLGRLGASADRVDVCEAGRQLKFPSARSANTKVCTRVTSALNSDKAEEESQEHGKKRYSGVDVEELAHDGHCRDDADEKCADPGPDGHLVLWRSRIFD